VSDENNETAMEVARPANGVVRQGFGTQEIEHRRETQGSALAARAQAEVQARYIMAERKPRNLETFRVNLLKHCKRAGFALVAEYAKPVGGTSVKGPSIRFVETALREYTNVEPVEVITYDDDMKRVTKVSVTDLESNITYSADVEVAKTVERKKTKNGDEVLGSRTNSYGDVVFKIRATDDDFANKSAAACSKQLRKLGLRILPADIVDEAMEACRQMRQAKDAQDPTAARRQIIDKFAELGVLPAAIDEYLGHPLDQSSPAEMDELRAAYATIRDGETRWTDLIEMQRVRRGEVEKGSKDSETAGAKVKAKLEAVRAKRNGSAETRPVIDVKE
jgi:hypothetical protein